MGKKSVRQNKNVYQLSREKCGLTREAAAEKLSPYVTTDRIEKIEYGTSKAHPEEVLAMAQAYQNPTLCNYFCTKECAIGEKYVPEVEMKALSQITLEMLANLNALSREKDRLVEIAVDGEISAEEKKDFKRIKCLLREMSATLETLKLWAQQLPDEE